MIRAKVSNGITASFSLVESPIVEEAQSSRDEGQISF